MNKKGDIAKAMAYAQKALAAAERARDEDLIAEACYVLANIEDERENYVEAERYLARSMSIFESHQTTQGLARAHTAAASMAFTQQRIDEARAATRSSAAKYAEPARRPLHAGQERLDVGKDPVVAGRPRSGEREVRRGARRRSRSCETPYELARLLFDIGLLKDEPEEATQTIRSAIRIFERLEATHDLERARGALFRIKPAGKAPDSGVVGLYEVVKIINSTLNLEEVLNRVLDLAIRRVRAERGMILLLDPITSALRTRIVRNIKDTEGGSRRSPQSIVKEVIQSGQSVISADARADARFVESESVIAENIMSILCVPLVIRDRIAGAIYVDHREARHLFSQKDLTFLEAFADQAAIAIENARLYEELEEARARLSLENESLRREVLVEKHLDSVVGNSEAVAKIQFAIRKAVGGTFDRAAARRVGHGQGPDRAHHPQRFAAPERAVHHVQLRGASGDAGGVGAVRPREGIVHRRRPPQARTLRAGQRRHDLPRRDRQGQPGHAGQAAARRRGQGVRARRRHADASRPTSRSSPRRTSTSRRPSSRGRSARISTTA